MDLHHLALRVVDCERSAAFYAGVLGLPELRRSERGVWLRLGCAALMLERALRGVGAEAGSGHLLSLAVDDLSAWETRLARAGVAVVRHRIQRETQYVGAQVALSK